MRTSRTKEEAPAPRRSLRIRAMSIVAFTRRPRGPHARSPHRQGTTRRRNRQKEQRHAVGLAVFQGLHAIVNVDQTVRVTPAKFPPTINATPNSPRVCAKLSTAASPLRAATTGKITRQNVLRPPAPRTADASAVFDRLPQRKRPALHRERKNCTALTPESVRRDVNASPWRRGRSTVFQRPARAHRHER